MLFTRCPNCETTFRITAEALRKADGQVRCGRCASVFNGYNELRRRARRRAGAAAQDSPAAEQERAHVPAPHVRVVAGAPRTDDAKQAGGSDRNGAGAAPALSASDDTPDGPRATPAAEAGPRSADLSASPKRRGGRKSSRAASAASAVTTEDEKDATLGDFSFAGVVAELEASAASEDADGVGASLSAIDLLAKNGLEPSLKSSTPDVGSRAGTADPSEALAHPAWVILDEARPQRVTPRAWMIGCGVTVALLALQVLHHYRGHLAVLGVVGPIVQQAYAVLGTEIAPAWDIEQYEIEVDWDAVAQPSADGESNLKIAARIRNEGTRALPLPHVQVQLKDRWESTIGSRVFAPAEYLPPGRAVDFVMKGGQSALAELDILDPGPQAYGFELDVCIDAENGALRCAADEVFR